jgi:hypothetical protein
MSEVTSSFLSVTERQMWNAVSFRSFQMISPFLLLQGCIQKFPRWVDNEIYANNNKHSLRTNTKGYGGKIQ